MNDIASRIGLGCARLSGGFAEANSRRVIAAALRSGIRYFDTAPSYGGGASERVLAAALRGCRDEVQLCTKVGLERASPRAAAEIKTMLLSGIRALLPERAVGRLNRVRRAQVQSLPQRTSRGNFDLTFMRSSVAQSLQELQTERLDCLLLHEPGSSDPNPEAAAALLALVASGTVTRLGVATGGDFDQLPAFGEVAQFKLGSAGFNAVDSRTRIGHGLLRGLNLAAVEQCAREAAVFESVPALKSLFAGPLGGGALLLNAVLFGSNIDRVLVSTTSPSRLQRFLSTAEDIYGEISVRLPDQSAAFGGFVGRYFDRLAGGR